MVMDHWSNDTMVSMYRSPLHNLIDHEVGIIEEILLLPRDIIWSWEINDVNMMDFPQEVSLMWDACLRLIRT